MGLPPYNGQRPKSATCLANRSFLHGLLPPAHLFCSVLEMCRRGGMLRPFPRWAGRTHEITLYPSAKLNAIALLFKKPFHHHIVFHNACTNELCEFMLADRGVLSIYCRATLLLQRVFLLLHSSCVASAYLMHLRPHAQQ